MVFLPFFSILSIIYIIRIASFSQRINVNSSEMLELFVLFLPDILFYTLPVSFIVAIGATLLKLSNTNELIALFSYSLSPIRLLRFFVAPAMLFSLLLLLLSMLLIPRSTFQFKQLKAQKIQNAQLSVEANKLGQKFGNYIFFTEKKDHEKLEHVVLFTRTKNREKIIFVANKGKLENANGVFRLDLIDGNGDTFSTDNIKSVEYSKMSLFRYLNKKKKKSKVPEWKNIYKNKKLMSNFTYNIFISLSPLLSLFLVGGLSIINPRYQKISIYTISALILVIIYTLGSTLKNSGTLFILGLSIATIVTLGYGLFYKRVKSIF